ncbi:hypothetical protein [Glutamicibacter sp. TV12E]|uniref:hypothetical protein n=1 Tax=Glutamicibacter sp. TV12E TaxID=3446362 RepID=UPI004034CF31
MSDEASVAVELWGTAPALLTSLAAVVIALKSQRTDRQAFLADMRRQWDSLEKEWATSLLYTNGSDYFYSPASEEDRNRVGRIIEETNETGDVPLGTMGFERGNLRKVVRFFVYAADSLISGKWTLAEAYLLFGPDVARHFKTILWMSSRSRIRPKGRRDPELTEWQDRVDDLTEFNFYDEQEAVYLFAFLLRAEQCRRGDTYPHFIVDLAQRLNAGEYQKLRTYLARASRNRGRWSAKYRLIRTLRDARRPRVASAFTHSQDPLVGPEEMHLFRRTIFSRRATIRKARKLQSKAEMD